MPTGYTAVLLENPDTTFASFAMRCARNFGVCIEMRDEPLDVAPPTEIRPSLEVLDRLRAAEAEARRFEIMTLEEAERLDAAAYEESVESWEHGKAQHDRERDLFGAMLKQAIDWKPPTEAHKGLQKFMIEQLEASMPRAEYWAKPVRKGGARYLAEGRRNAAETVRDRAEDWKRAQDSAATKTEWLRLLRESLGRTSATGGGGT